MVGRSGILGFALIMAVSATARGEETLRFGTYREYPPLTIPNADGTLRGFEIDIIGELCRRLAVQHTVAAVTWERVFDDLDAGRYDVYLGGMAATEVRARRVDFSHPYMVTTARFTTRADSPLTQVPLLNRINLDDMTPEATVSLESLMEALRGYRVGVHVDTIHEAFLHAHLTQETDLHRYTVEDKQYEDILAGRLDAVLASSSTAYYFISNHQTATAPLVFFGPVLSGRIFGSGVAAAVRHGNRALLDRLNGALDAAKADGTLAKLSFTWFGFNVAAP